MSSRHAPCAYEEEKRADGACGMPLDRLARSCLGRCVKEGFDRLLRSQGQWSPSQEW